MEESLPAEGSPHPFWEAQLWSWCLALIPSCGWGRLSHTLGYDSLFCFCFGFGRKSLASLLWICTNTHEGDRREKLPGDLFLPPSIPGDAAESFPFRTTPANLHHRKRMPSSKQTTSWSSNDGLSLKPPVLLIQVSSVHGLTQSNFNGTGEDKKQKQRQSSDN